MAGVGDGDRGLVGDPCQGGKLVRSEVVLFRAADGDGAEDFAVEDDGGGRGGSVADASRKLSQLTVAGVIEDVWRGGNSSLENRPASDSLAEGDLFLRQQLSGLGTAVEYFERFTVNIRHNYAGNGIAGKGGR